MAKAKAEEPMVAVTERVPMDYPLPRRDWYKTSNGWASREWSRDEYAWAQANHFKNVTRLVPRSEAKRLGVKT